jgi:hypothetical protein
VHWCIKTPVHQCTEESGEELTKLVLVGDKFLNRWDPILHGLVEYSKFKRTLAHNDITKVVPMFFLKKIEGYCDDNIHVIRFQ